MPLLLSIFVCLSSPLLFAGGGNDVFFHQRTEVTPTSKITAGRYMYIGTAPRFEAPELNLFVSKMGLTLRVQAWVKSSLHNEYAVILAKRFLKIAGALRDSEKLRLLPLASSDTLVANKKDAFEKLWISIAAIYSEHLLANSELDVLSPELSTIQLHENVIVSLARTYFLDPNLNLESALALAEEVVKSPENFADLSQKLFDAHLGESFTKSTDHGDGYLGYLTMVYPIAANAAGPFSSPSEAVYSLGLSGSIESRWWSDKWGDEFGGFPFLQFTAGGVAFHGPISNRSTVEAWYLRRDFASHGCMRMSPSDILELRALLPSNITKLKDATKSGGVSVTVMNWPDVTDWNNSGEKKVVDVGYYGMPTGFPSTKTTLTNAIEGWRPAKQQSRFYQNHYSKYNGKLPSNNSFDANTATFSGLPVYTIANNKVSVSSYYPESLSVAVFPIKKQRILQYIESGVRFRGYDDNDGKYPPAYFNAR